MSLCPIACSFRGEEILHSLDRVLVTGAHGVIGRAVVSLLRSQGRDVVEVGSDAADLRRLDEADRLMVEFQPTSIIHLAARVHGLMGNVGRQGDMFFDNLQINSNVIDAGRRAGVSKIVAMGSVAVYSDTVDLPIRESDFWTGPPHASEFGYGHAKRAMLAQLESYQDQFGMDFAFAVSTNLFGPNDRFDEVQGHVLPSLLSKFYRAVQQGGPVSVWGTGRATRDFLFSYDAAQALVRLLDSGSGVYNVASGSDVTIRELVELLVEVTGFDDVIEWDASKPDGQAARAYDITRIAALGWAPQYQLADALALTYRWYEANVDSVRR